MFCRLEVDDVILNIAVHNHVNKVYYINHVCRSIYNYMQPHDQQVDMEIITP